MEKLYYISQGDTPQKHLQHIENVCKAGVQLVQLRLKNTTEVTYLKTAQEAKYICDTYNATLIINDQITIAQKVGAGVHLGQNDDTISKAKRILGDATIIGGTANTLEECLKLIHQRVDYIGLGPFAHTTTKKKLSPVLGLEGYQTILSALNSKGYTTPVYAIGGITFKDIFFLQDTGIYGIAASGLLSNATFEDIQQILDKIKK